MRRHFFALLLSVATVFLSLDSSSQASSNLRNQTLLLKRVIELNHYWPHAINDSFSARVFHDFIERLNQDDEILGKPELSSLSKYTYTIDDELNGTGWEFVDHATIVYERALRSADSALAKSKKDPKKQRRIARILQHPDGLRQHVFTTFLDVLANSFDPHTEYMPPIEKRDFEASLDTKGYHFGFALEENDEGQVEISRVMPGSPAWKSGHLNAGDIVLKLGWEGQQPIDVPATERSELAEIFNDGGDRKLAMTVRKADGTEKTAVLARELITNEENTIRGYILKGTRKIGYIYLPDFYTGYEGRNASSANDVAKEIVKLRKENIDGLILDLRYNGGGSLQEALDMAGIFVDAGPLCLVREKSGKISSIKDMNRGTIYDGPLAILINGQSASASELLGAVLQDYNRAVVVGSRSFGKGTFQQILPLDTTGKLSTSAIPGFVKVTTGKYYRVRGTSVQKTGLVPDIVLPDIFDGLSYKESAYDNALASDSVPKNQYYQPLSAIPISALSEKSGKRVSSHEQFKAVQKHVDALKSGKELDPSSDMPSLAKPQYAVTSNAFDETVTRSSDYYAAINRSWIERISTDIYIEEACHVLEDLISITLNKP
jgi:carboxyl-terminal processing protease